MACLNGFVLDTINVEYCRGTSWRKAVSPKHGLRRKCHLSLSGDRGRKVILGKALDFP